MGRVSYIEQAPYMSAEYMAASEHLHQSAFFEFIRKSRRALINVSFAIPNGGSRQAVEAARLKVEGVTAGIPDVMIAFPTNGSPGLFLEFKGMNAKDKPSAVQVEKLQALRDAGYIAVVVHGWAQGVEALNLYLACGRMPDFKTETGINYPEQIKGNYSPASWKI